MELALIKTQLSSFPGYYFNIYSKHTVLLLPDYITHSGISSWQNVLQVFQTIGIFLETHQPVIWVLFITYMELSEMQEFNVLDTQPAEAMPLSEDIESLLMMWLVGTTVFLGLLLILVVSICLSQRARYQRQLKAATVTAFGNVLSFEMLTSNNVTTAIDDDPSYFNSQRVIQRLLQRLEKCTVLYIKACTY